MTQPRDNWHKPRSRGQHLTADEIALIRAAYVAGRHATNIARELQCSSRIAYKYYEFFRCEGVERPVVKRFRPVIQNHLHKPNFEI